MIEGQPAIARAGYSAGRAATTSASKNGHHCGWSNDQPAATRSLIEMTVMRGERVVLRPATEDDLDAILAMLREPEVARWWGDYDAARVRRDHLDDDESETYAIEVGGELGGVLLVYEEPDPDYRHVALDISLRTELHGRGLGREALRVAIGHLASERGHHRFTIDPSADNERAIRCYTAVGFAPVGTLRRYWRAPGGEWRDGLLMDLLHPGRRAT
jgi:aminoglycoside 6'-N-acetyltransferase